MENQGNMTRNNVIDSTEGSMNSDLDMSTTAGVRNMESGSQQEGAAYPGDMNTGGYGGSRNTSDDTVPNHSIRDTDDDSLMDDDDVLADEDADLDDEMDDEDEARTGF